MKKKKKLYPLRCFRQTAILSTGEKQPIKGLVTSTPARISWCANFWERKMVQLIARSNLDHFPLHQSTKFGEDRPKTASLEPFKTLAMRTSAHADFTHAYCDFRIIIHICTKFCEDGPKMASLEPFKILEQNAGSQCHYLNGRDATAHLSEPLPKISAKSVKYNRLWIRKKLS